MDFKRMLAMLDSQAGRCKALRYIGAQVDFLGMDAHLSAREKMLGG